MPADERRGCGEMVYSCTNSSYKGRVGIYGVFRDGGESMVEMVCLGTKIAKSGGWGKVVYIMSNYGHAVTLKNSDER
jgi:hypothetical protein